MHGVLTWYSSLLLQSRAWIAAKGRVDAIDRAPLPLRQPALQHLIGTQPAKVAAAPAYQHDVAAYAARRKQLRHTLRRRKPRPAHADLRHGAVVHPVAIARANRGNILTCEFFKQRVVGYARSVPKEQLAKARVRQTDIAIGGISRIFDTLRCNRYGHGIVLWYPFDRIILIDAHVPTVNSDISRKP